MWAVSPQPLNIPHAFVLSVLLLGGEVSLSQFYRWGTEPIKSKWPVQKSSKTKVWIILSRHLAVRKKIWAENVFSSSIYLNSSEAFTACFKYREAHARQGESYDIFFFPPTCTYSSFLFLLSEELRVSISSYLKTGFGRVLKPAKQLSILVASCFFTLPLKPWMFSSFFFSS